MRRLGPSFLVIVVSAHAAGAGALKPAAPEIATSPRKVALPPIPPFSVWPVADGVHDPRELRLAGRAVLDTEIKLRGYVIWLHRCPYDQKKFDADPTLCERPKMYLGATRAVRPERGTWVVDVPLAKLAVGDYVVVTGDWRLVSPHGDRNSDGLLVWKSMVAAKPPVAPVAPVAPVELVEPPIMLPGLPPPAAVEAPASPQVRAGSITALNACSAAIVQNKIPEAVPHCEHALAVWPNNHLAHYTLAVAGSITGDWKRAAEEASAAVDQRADAPQYQLMLGVTLYERAVADARAAGVELTKVNYEEARAHLAIAVAQEPRLWRAHYYVGRILRDTGHPHAAAEALGTAVVLNPAEPGPSVALAELYRKWDAADQAIVVARDGATNIPTSAELAFVLGMAFDDKLQPTMAIEAFTRALAVDPKHARAQFQRGLDRFRAGDVENARADLEAALHSPALPAWAKQFASAMLIEMAAKK